MKESNEYDVNEAPVSGAYAGLDPDQQPVIVDAMGERVGEFAPDHVPSPGENAENAALLDALMDLCLTHNVQIETDSAKPLHRIVIGAEGDFRKALSGALKAALAHHAKGGA
jgi:hypothetical protein